NTPPPTLRATLTASIEAAMLQERPDIARMQILEMQKTTPVEGLTVYRRNGVEAFTDTSTLMQGMKEAELQPGVLDSIKKMERPEGPSMSGSPALQAVERLRTQEALLNGKGQPLLVLARPIANQEGCQGCHGTDHRVRAVVRVATWRDRVMNAVGAHHNRQLLVALLTI